MADRLLDLLRDKALLRGEFSLSSGGSSTVYVNAKLVTLDPEGAVLVARAVLDRCAAFGGPVHAVGGPTIGADPIAGAVAAVSRLEGRPVSGFLVRKEAKGHGTRVLLENPPREGSRVVVVEDVVSTGRSTLEAVRKVEGAGLLVAGIVCVVDREAGGAEMLSGYDYRPLYHLSELLSDAAGRPANGV